MLTPTLTNLMTFKKFQRQNSHCRPPPLPSQTLHPGENHRVCESSLSWWTSRLGITALKGPRAYAYCSKARPKGLSALVIVFEPLLKIFQWLLSATLLPLPTPKPQPQMLS